MISQPQSSPDPLLDDRVATDCPLSRFVPADVVEDQTISATRVRVIQVPQRGDFPSTGQYLTPSDRLSPAVWFCLSVNSRRRLRSHSCKRTLGRSSSPNSTHRRLAAPWSLYDHDATARRCVRGPRPVQGPQTN
jgi:hypothetical protein